MIRASNRSVLARDSLIVEDYVISAGRTAYPGLVQDQFDLGLLAGDLI
jgi:hypothetical protein